MNWRHQALLLVLLLLGACTETATLTNSPSSKEVIKLWVAPNEAQEAFWKIAVDRWNASGLGLPVDFTTIPSTGNSEEAILKAMLADSAPDVSTNIFSVFAAQLADLGQLEDLTAFDGYDELISARQMENIMRGWQLDGSAYVFPIYSNPTMIWWRKDILQKLGFKGVPKTFDDVYWLSREYAKLENKYGMEVMFSPGWEHRWFDFISYYYAASDGAPYLTQGKSVYNNEAGLSVLQFINKMFANEWTAASFGEEDPLITGTAIGAVRGPWSIESYRRLYPHILDNIAIGPIVRKEVAAGETHTLADTKGLVLFKHSKVKKQAFEFISWVFSNEELSVLWLEKTGLPPARGDLSSNALFQNFYRSHPLAKAYADQVSASVPPAFTEFTIEVQKIMSNMMESIKYAQTSPEVAISDAVEKTNELLVRMQ
jgi:multiple sugar transport system substrate-binding protein